MNKKKIKKASLARQLTGIWRNRKDLKGIDRLLHGEQAAVPTGCNSPEHLLLQVPVCNTLSV